MPNIYFKCKQFVVQQNRCAMKVGTDGMLLGAWTRYHACRTLLDVGTGTGIIAMMLAQRNTDALVDAVEIDGDAARQATENVQNSPFAARINVCHNSYQDFAADNITKKYDLIVSNPPFFSQSLTSSTHSRTLARHDASLSVATLVALAKKQLSEEGVIALVLPFDMKQRIIDIANENKLFLRRITYVKPLPESAYKRLLIELSNQECNPSENELIIETERHRYTPEYINLTKDFYLNF